MINPFSQSEIHAIPWMVASLLKDLSQNSSSPILAPYNDESVKVSIEEFKSLYQDFINCLKISETDPKNISCKAKTFIVATQLKRHKRVLLSYHMERLMKIAHRLTCSKDFAQETIINLSKAETKFYHLHTDCITKYKSSIGNHIDLFGPVIPPKDFYVQVRVEQDCGVIQTEFGRVNLNQGTLHYLKRNDVEHLIVKGLLTHIV